MRRYDMDLDDDGIAYHELVERQRQKSAAKWTRPTDELDLRWQRVIGVACLIGAALIFILMIAGCSGGGGEEAGPAPVVQAESPRPVTPKPNSPKPPPPAQPDMLVATPQGLLRGKADGQGQRLIFAKTDFNESFTALSQGHVLYTDRGDIWAVLTDGTNNRAVINTPDQEFIRATNGPWLIYGQTIRQPSGSLIDRYGSVNIETGAQFMFDDEEGTDFIPQNPSRLISTTSMLQISSLNVMGGDRMTYASVPFRSGMFLATQGIVGNALIYSHAASIAPDTFFYRAYTIPVTGGTATLLDEERYDTYSAWSMGERVVYHRTAPFPAFGQNDVVSIQNDGTNRVVLTTNPANEAVQGVVGDQVIIRRNLAGNDQLFSIPVLGGQEKLLMVMTDDEFVTLVVDDLLVLRRPSGTWILDMSGKLTKLGTVSGFEAVAVGDSVCINMVTSPSASALWCMPLDGSSPQVKIADNGNVVGVL